MFNGSIKLPLFIVFEGIDGAGKTTLRDKFADFLIENKYDIKKLNEPTASIYGKKIRELLKSDTLPETNLLLDLFIQDREHNVQNNINPALNSNNIILMDRYFYSNAAYQGASGTSVKKILEMNLKNNFPKPDRIYYVDITPDEALTRIMNRNKILGTEHECFEKKDYLEKVRENFLSIIDERFIKIDGTLSTEEQLEIILFDIKENFIK